MFFSSVKRGAYYPSLSDIGESLETVDLIFMLQTTCNNAIFSVYGIFFEAFQKKPLLIEASELEEDRFILVSSFRDFSYKLAGSIVGGSW